MGQQLPGQQLPLRLVPLHVAVRVVYLAVYRREHDEEGANDERLTGLAQAIAALVPLYTTSRNEEGVRRLTDEEVSEGRVRRAGRELQFSDSRPPLGELRISRTGMDHVIGLLESVKEDPAPAQTGDSVPRKRPGRQR